MIATILTGFISLKNALLSEWVSNCVINSWLAHVPRLINKWYCRASPWRISISQEGCFSNYGIIQVETELGGNIKIIRYSRIFNCSYLLGT